MYPEYIHIVGGGRWAKVIVEVLCSFLPASVNIYIYTSYNKVQVSEWIEAHKFTQTIKVLSVPFQIEDKKNNVAIIANSAGDHYKTAKLSISKGIPVLVEKPMALTSEESFYLIKLADQHSVKISVSQIFLFTRYLEKYKNIISNYGDIKHIRVFWYDPLKENRYGENKYYDSSLPIYADLLPHILPILAYLTKNQGQVCKDVKFMCGGAHLVIDLLIGNISCKVELKRNAKNRKRIIEVDNSRESAVLDFSLEPGIIKNQNKILNGDPDWNILPHPLETMLSAFLIWVTEGKFDKRLKTNNSLNASYVIDEIKNLYKHEQKSWLIEKIKGKNFNMDEDLTYTLYEIFQHEKKMSKENVNERIRKLERQIKNRSAGIILGELIKAPNYLSYIANNCN